MQQQPGDLDELYHSMALLTMESDIQQPLCGPLTPAILSRRWENRMGASVFPLLPVSILTDRTATVRPGVSFAVKVAFYKFMWIILETSV